MPFATRQREEHKHFDSRDFLLKMFWLLGCRDRKVAAYQLANILKAIAIAYILAMPYGYEP